MKESTLKRNFRKWLDKENKIGFKDEALSKVIPRSIRKGYSVTKKVTYKSLVGKEIIAEYSKCCNVVWLLVKKEEVLDKYYNWLFCKYEVYMIEPERGNYDLYFPYLYKVL